MGCGCTDGADEIKSAAMAKSCNNNNKPQEREEGKGGGTEALPKKVQTGGPVDKSISSLLSAVNQYIQFHMFYK